MDREKLVSDQAALAAFNRGGVEEFRANGGQVGAQPAGIPLFELVRA